MAGVSRRTHSALAQIILLSAAACFVLSCLSTQRDVSPPAFVSGAAAATARASRSHIGMQSDKTDAIVEELKTLTLLEASELVSAIEETFGVDASASGGAVMMAAPAGGGEAEEKAPEKSEFDLTLKEVPKDKKIAILKVVRSLLGVGLKEAKGMVDNPGKIMEGKPKDLCDDAKTQLEEAGATVEIA